MFEKDKFVGYNPSPYSPNNIIPSLIPPHSTIFDVGSGPGILGMVLTKQGKKCICDGVDINKSFLRQAKKFYRNLYAFDLNGNVDLGKEKYDFIVFADILEHLQRPDLVLKKFKKFLKKNGKIIISLPNIARFENRLNLLFGKFDYEESGIMHRDHLRFFTFNSGKKMIEGAGFKVVEVRYTGLGAMLKLLPTFTSFQFIFICQKKENSL